jgi:hypothetical protein
MYLSGISPGLSVLQLGLRRGTRAGMAACGEGSKADGHGGAQSGSAAAQARGPGEYCGPLPHCCPPYRGPRVRVLYVPSSPRSLSLSVCVADPTCSGREVERWQQAAAAATAAASDRGADQLCDAGQERGRDIRSEARQAEDPRTRFFRCHSLLVSCLTWPVSTAGGTL